MGPRACETTIKILCTILDIVRMCEGLYDEL